ncbi:cytochrome P450 [Lentinula detonsa]|uniref:Cytochrome P450 n=1 Tax=Lentinula detonsa TaxID=2804962 RepID=A0A9W8P2J7_9AGAR|nr:cytochrome P450 [Lentinula detonsa]
METSLLLLVCLLTSAVFILKAKLSSPLRNIPGPKSESFVLGHLRELLQQPAGLAEIEWQRKYGDIVRIKASFGSEQLLVADPKALQHILCSGYKWRRSPVRREMGRLTSGKGLAWADGETHKRHRKLMTPGFRASETKHFVPIFFACAEAMSTEWKKTISKSDEKFQVFDFTDHLSHATLDAIGLAAFDYDFGSIHNHENELAKAYQGLTAKAFRAPSNMGLLVLDLFKHVPSTVMEFMNDHNPRLKPLHHVARVGNDVAKQLIAQKVEEIEQGTPNKDIYTSLVQSNLQESSKTRLSGDELVAQMRNLLFELARNPTLQDKLRAEIKSTGRKIKDRGESEFTLNDLEAMPLLNAMCKETLRYYPIAIHLFRTANEDDVIPLSKPMIGTTGKVITNIAVPKGTQIVGSPQLYNRNPEIFGEDASEFNTDRWIEGRIKTEDTLGMPYANLVTFAAGSRSCIGWRFAVAELQTFIVVLLRNFVIESTPKLAKIRRESALAMVPVIEGELDKGTQLPLRVYLVAE